MSGWDQGAGQATHTHVRVLHTSTLCVWSCVVCPWWGVGAGDSTAVVDPQFRVNGVQVRAKVDRHRFVKCRYT